MLNTSDDAGDGIAPLKVDDSVPQPARKTFAEQEMFDRFMALAYASGRTETFVAGQTSTDISLRDIDLRPAYPTARANIGYSSLPD